MIPVRTIRGLAAAVVLLLPGCADPGPVETPDDEGPYVVVAVDYHFHDAHPSKPITLDRVVEIDNQTNNLHNVTFTELGFDRNVRAGKDLRIDPIGELVEQPGVYSFVCKFHQDRGMTGVLVIVD